MSKEPRDNRQSTYATPVYFVKGVDRDTFDWTVFYDNPDLPALSIEERQRRIAQVLASGSPSPYFCYLLSAMFGVEGTENHTAFKASIEFKLVGRPPDDYRTGDEYIRLTSSGMTSDQAIFEIQKKFGVKGNSRSAIFKAAKWAKRLRALEVL